jgi:hypothetical protein
MSLANILVPNNLTLYMSNINTVDPQNNLIKQLFGGSQVVTTAAINVYTFTAQVGITYVCSTYTSAFCTAGPSVGNCYGTFGIYNVYINSGTLTITPLFNSGSSGNNYLSLDTSYVRINSGMKTGTGNIVNFTLGYDTTVSGNTWFYSWRLEVLQTV